MYMPWSIDYINTICKTCNILQLTAFSVILIFPINFLNAIPFNCLINQFPQSGKSSKFKDCSEHLFWFTIKNKNIPMLESDWKSFKDTVRDLSFPWWIFRLSFLCIAFGGRDVFSTCSYSYNRIYIYIYILIISKMYIVNFYQNKIKHKKEIKHTTFWLIQFITFGYFSK